MPIRKIVKNSVKYLFAYGANKLLFLAFIIFFARSGGAILLGKYAFAFAIIGIAGVFSELGISNVLVRDIARKREKAGEYIWNALFIKAVSSLIAVALVILLLNFIGKDSETTLSVYVLLGVFVLGSFKSVMLSALNAFEKAGKVASALIVHDIVTVSVALAMLFSGATLPFIMAGFLIGGIVSISYTTWLVRGIIFPYRNIRFQFCKRLLKRSLPYAAAGIFGVIVYYTGVILLSTLQGDKATGLYNAAGSPIAHAVSLNALFMLSALPVLTRLIESSKDVDKILLFANRIIRFVMLPLLAVLFVFSREVLGIIYGIEFEPAATVLKILIIAQAIMLVISPKMLLVYAKGKQNSYLPVAGVAMIIGIILNVLLIPLYGINGVAFAVLGTNVFIFIQMSRKFKSILEAPATSA